MKASLMVSILVFIGPAAGPAVLLRLRKAGTGGNHGGGQKAAQIFTNRTCGNGYNAASYEAGMGGKGSL